MELNMESLDAKKLALAALRRKVRQLEQENSMSDMSTDEKGYNNQVEDAREEGEVRAVTEGEGRPQLSLELEVENESEGDDGEKEGGLLSELHKRMREDFRAEPESRKAQGKKVSLHGGMNEVVSTVHKFMKLGKKK
jgi:hypothetical protein